MPGIGESSQRDADNGVQQGKAKAGEQAELGVGNSKLRYQVRTHHREESAVDKVQNVNEGQGGENVASIGLTAVASVLCMRVVVGRCGLCHVRISQYWWCLLLDLSAPNLTKETGHVIS